jgi:hypothetical protein
VPSSEIRTLGSAFGRRPSSWIRTTHRSQSAKKRKAFGLNMHMFATERCVILRSETLKAIESTPLV